MDVYVPLEKKENSTFDPIMSNFVNVILQQLKHVQVQLYSKISDLNMSEKKFKDETKKTKCSSKNTISLKHYKDIACVPDNKAVLCDPNKVKADESYDDSYLIKRGDIFNLDGQCYANDTIPTSTCAVFQRFFPTQSTPMILMWREKCLYKIIYEIENKNRYAIVFALTVDNKKRLYIIEEVNQFDPSRPSIFDLDLHDDTVMTKLKESMSRTSSEYVNLSDVLSFQGPCILNEFVESRQQGKKCKYEYTNFLHHQKSHKNNHNLDYRHMMIDDLTRDKFKAYEDLFLPSTDNVNIGNVSKPELPIKYVGWDNLELFKLSDEIHIFEEDDTISIKNRDFYDENIIVRCGLSTYVRGRIGYNNIISEDTLANQEFDIENAQQRGHTVFTSSVIYFLSQNPTLRKPKPDLEIAQYGIDHERDALLSLQRHLQDSNLMDVRVVPNTNHYIYVVSSAGVDVKLGATPDAFLLQGDVVIGTVESKCHIGDKNFISNDAILQAETQFYVMEKLLRKELLKYYIVSWTRNETRIYECDRENRMFEDEDWKKFSLDLDKKKIYNFRDSFSEYKFKMKEHERVHTVKSVQRRKNTVRVNTKRIKVKSEGKNFDDVWIPIDKSNRIERTDLKIKFDRKDLIEKQDTLYIDELFKEDTLHGEQLWRCRSRVKLPYESFENADAYFVPITDEFSTTVNYQILNHETLEKVFTNDETSLTPESILLHLLKTPRSEKEVTTKKIVVLDTNADGLCTDMTLARFVIKSNPVFAQKASIEEYIANHMENVVIFEQVVLLKDLGVIVPIANNDTIIPGAKIKYKNTICTIVDIVIRDGRVFHKLIKDHQIFEVDLDFERDTWSELSLVETQDGYLTTSYIFNLNGVLCCNYYLSKNDVPAYVIVNYNVYNTINTLIEKEYEYDARFWCYLFMLISKTEHFDCTIHVSKTLVLNKKHITEHIVEAYSLYKNMHANYIRNFSKIGYFNSKPVLERLNLIGLYSAHTKIKFSSTYINNALKSVHLI